MWLVVTVVGIRMDSTAIDMEGSRHGFPHRWRDCGTRTRPCTWYRSWEWEPGTLSSVLSIINISLKIDWDSWRPPNIVNSSVSLQVGWGNQPPTAGFVLAPFSPRGSPVLKQRNFHLSPFVVPYKEGGNLLVQKGWLPGPEKSASAPPSAQSCSVKAVQRPGFLSQAHGPPVVSRTPTPCWLRITRSAFGVPATPFPHDSAPRHFPH